MDSELFELIYEPNIIHNPSKWMGIWTPQGWRIHRKRFGKARRYCVHLSGDGKTTHFPTALISKSTGQSTWREDLHLEGSDDPFVDGGIYPCDPRVEYPVGRPRWAVSHTLHHYPYADHGLYTHEYTWDLRRGYLQTHFRQHVRLEEAVTDAKDGRTVLTRHKPISRTIEGNVHYPLPNSAVRGVWLNRDKSGENLYTRRRTRWLPMANGVYLVIDGCPVVQCHGLYHFEEHEDPSRLFDSTTGDCLDSDRLEGEYLVPISEPKVSLFLPRLMDVPSKIYEQNVKVPAERFVTIGPERLEHLERRMGTAFKHGCVGYGDARYRCAHIEGNFGYFPEFDFESDGTITQADRERLEPWVGKTVRSNLYVHAYYGGDWMSGCVLLEPNHLPGRKVVVDYEQGAGYDADSGTIRLWETPGPNQPVWIEYHYDAPAEKGEDNIRVHLYEETQ